MSEEGIELVATEEVNVVYQDKSDWSRELERVIKLKPAARERMSMHPDPRALLAGTNIGVNGITRLMALVNGYSEAYGFDGDGDARALGVTKTSDGLGVPSDIQGLLDEGEDPSAQDDRGRCALHHAAISRASGYAACLINAGAYVNEKDNDGRTALHHATMTTGDADILRVLLAIPGTVNVVDSNGNTPLHYAVAIGDADTAQALISAGADVNTSDVYGRTPLHYAALNNVPEPVIAILLAAKVDPNAQSHAGMTALHYLAISGFSSEKTWDALVAAGADATIKDGEGNTASHRIAEHTAEQRGRAYKRAYLVENGRD